MPIVRYMQQNICITVLFSAEENMSQSKYAANNLWAELYINSSCVLIFKFKNKLIFVFQSSNTDGQKYFEQSKFDNKRFCGWPPPPSPTCSVKDKTLFYFSSQYGFRFKYSHLLSLTHVSMKDCRWWFWCEIVTDNLDERFSLVIFYFQLRFQNFCCSHHPDRGIGGLPAMKDLKLTVKMFSEVIFALPFGFYVSNKNILFSIEQKKAF